MCWWIFLDHCTLLNASLHFTRLFSVISPLEMEINKLNCKWQTLRPHLNVLAFCATWINFTIEHIVCGVSHNVTLQALSVVHSNGVPYENGLWPYFHTFSSYRFLFSLFICTVQMSNKFCLIFLAKLFSICNLIYYALWSSPDFIYFHS